MNGQHITRADRVYDDSAVIDQGRLFGLHPQFRHPQNRCESPLFDAMHRELGEDTFRSVLHTYADQYRWQIAAPQDLIEVAESVSGKDLDDLYNRWILSKQPLFSGAAAALDSYVDLIWKTTPHHRSKPQSCRRSATAYPDTPQSRRVMHVAATRAVEQLWVISVGRPSPILPQPGTEEADRQPSSADQYHQRSTSKEVT